MRRISFLIFLIFGQFLFSQERYLVTPNNEYQPIPKSSGAIHEIEKHFNKAGSDALDRCKSNFDFGYPPDLWPINSIWGAHHRDVLAQWYVAKATGAVDTIFWMVAGDIGTADSIIFVSIRRSSIGPDYGPGIRPGPFNPPCQNWGYWNSDLDPDRGVAAFPEDAYPDTTWHSTYNGPFSTRPPFPTSLEPWQTYGVKLHAGINYLALDTSDHFENNFTAGDKFFITFQMNHGRNDHFHDIYTGFYAWGGMVSTADENYPSRFWKFYEHDSGVSGGCGGLPQEQVKRGWVARGGFSNDSLDVTLLDVWYTTNAKTNVPPRISSVPGGMPFNTLSTGAMTVKYDIFDCNPSYPESGVVASAIIKWANARTDELNFADQGDIPMTNTQADIWQADIPGQPPGTTVRYHIVATDINGMSSATGPASYKVLSAVNRFYRVDTGFAVNWKDIRSAGTTIRKPEFFSPDAYGVPFPADDGTAGPYDLGGSMIFFGDEVRYAWVGVNGAIALSKNATDTIDVNSNGYYIHGWDVPGEQRSGRWDSSDADRMPPNFIAPFWNDQIAYDSLRSYGRIMHGNAGDTCLFIVEWDSIGIFKDYFGSFADNTTYRIVLNRCDGTIEFQYNSIGTLGQDSTALVCMQQGSNSLGGPKPGYVFICKDAHPYELKPGNNWAIKFFPGTPFFAEPGWNMVSVSTVPLDYHADKAYPEAISDLFQYHAAYEPAHVLKNGKGYWAKFGGATYAGVPGFPIYELCDSVSAGWNIIGSSSRPIKTTGIQENPPGIVTSVFFNYGSVGYNAADALSPGRAYWVRVSSAGTLCIGSQLAMRGAAKLADFEGMNKFTIGDMGGRAQTLYLGEEELLKSPPRMYEMPPAAPDFDARFTTGLIAETYPAELRTEAGHEYKIRIQTSAYPVTFSWDISRPAEKLKMTLDAGGELCEMRESGKILLEDVNLKYLTITLNRSENLPKDFALFQNYPNPFNPATDIRYDLCVDARVNRKIFNILGQEVINLVDESQAAGYRSAKWNSVNNAGTAVAGGVYFYRLDAAGTRDPARSFTQVKKMLLLR